MNTTQKYCPLIEGNCLESNCSLYHLKESQCAVLSACDVIKDFQQVLVQQTGSCMEIMDLLTVLDARTNQIQQNS
jgi:hypothetical protein